MATAVKSVILPFAQPETEPNANTIHFLDEARLPCQFLTFRKTFASCHVSSR